MTYLFISTFRFVCLYMFTKKKKHTKGYLMKQVLGRRRWFSKSGMHANALA